MSSSGCSISLSNERKRFQEVIALVWRVDRDAFGGTQWPRFHIRQHIQKNANRVFCAACLERGGVDGDASAVQDVGIA